MKTKLILNTALCSVSFLLFACNSNAQHPKKGDKKPERDSIFMKLDVNKDNKISKAEAKGPLEKDFDKIDSNKDGFITKEEFASAPPPPKDGRPPKK